MLRVHLGDLIISKILSTAPQQVNNQRKLHNQ